jgi:hypothetical protein
LSVGWISTRLGCERQPKHWGKLDGNKAFMY